MQTVYIYVKENNLPITYTNVISCQIWTPSHGMETIVIKQDKVTTHFLRKHIYRYAIHDDT